MIRANDMTAAQLERMAGHVLFEYRMWDWARISLLGDPLVSPERNAQIDAYLLHGRNLLDFLTNTANQADDIVARHFASNWVPRSEGSSVAEAIRFTRKELNKRFAHLSTRRLEGDGLPDAHQAWSQLGTMLLDEWGRFLSELSEERRAWFGIPYSASG
jgi:hypothetical protein